MTRDMSTAIGALLITASVWIFGGFWLAVWVFALCVKFM